MYLNKVQLIGNLGQDPELRYTPSGRAVANFSMATTKHWKDKTSGEPRDRTSWHKVTVWGKQAETAKKYLKKGSPCYVEGELSSSTWVDKEGVKRFQIVVEAFQIQFVPSGDKDKAGKVDSCPPPPLDEHFDIEVPQDVDDQVIDAVEGGDGMPF